MALYRWLYDLVLVANDWIVLPVTIVNEKDIPSEFAAHSACAAGQIPKVDCRNGLILAFLRVMQEQVLRGKVYSVKQGACSNEKLKVTFQKCILYRLSDERR